MVREPGEYRIILNTDNPAFGGHGRIDESTVFFSRYDEEKSLNVLSLYNTNRTALVLENQNIIKKKG